MSEYHGDAGRSGRGILSRRGLFFGAGAALVAAAGGLLYRHISSTSSVKVESFMTPASGKKKRIFCRDARPGNGEKERQAVAHNGRFLTVPFLINI